MMYRSPLRPRVGSLGFDAVADEVFRDVVFARVGERMSLLDTARVVTDLGRVPAGYATMKRTWRVG